MSSGNMAIGTEYRRRAYMVATVLKLEPNAPFLEMGRFTSYRSSNGTVSRSHPTRSL